MKYKTLKKLVFLSFICCFSMSIFSQNMNEKVIKPTLKKDDIVFDLYTGYPMWGAYHTRVHAKSEGADNISTKGIPPVGLKGEIMLSELFSFSVDALFDSWGGSWNTSKMIDSYDDETQTNITEEVMFNYDYNVSRFRFQIGINYHMDDITVKNLDLYGGVAIGTNRIWETVNSNDKNFDLEDRNYFLLTDGLLVGSPISLRARIGARYFFTPNMGINLELNVGGPTIAFGIAYLL